MAPSLPVELVCDILLAAAAADPSAFAALTSASRATRRLFWSAAAHAAVLVGRHGRGGALDHAGGCLAAWGNRRIDHHAVISAVVRRCGAAVVRAGEWSALRAACGKQRCVALVRAVLDVSPEGVAAKDHEAFREACRFNNVEIASLLLKYGADVHARADEPLRFSACFGNATMVQFLLENNASVSALYNSPLFGAIDMGHDDIVLMLLAAGADPNIPMNGIAGGRSPLQASVLQGRLALVEPLINYGANVQYQNNAAKRDAIRRNLWDIVAILEKAEVLSRSQSFV